VSGSSRETAAASQGSGTAPEDPPGRVSWLVPPADLLSRVRGVEPVLRRGQTLQKIGWSAFALSVLSALGSIFTSQWWTTFAGTSWNQGLHRWLVISGVALLVVAALLVGWLRLWVRASRTPFRYTYSIEEFEPVTGTTPEQQLAWLRHDLSTRLSRRIRRLALLDERYSGTTSAPEAHIHIGGAYGIRKKSSGDCVIEVMPWVRLGPTGSSAMLAHPVTFALAHGPLEFKSNAGAMSYEKLVERVYFSVATRIYRQIRDDVQRKINMLPRRYFRAAAYFYEAEDYIRSNTLDAYEQAQKLYAEVIRLYTPDWSDADSGRSSAGRLVRLADRLFANLSLGWRRWLAWLWPGPGRVELMVARAELGYARTLVYRRVVAGFSGQRLNPIFEARPMAKRAVWRVTRLRKDVPGRRKRLFDALVTEASVLAALGSFGEADKRLKAARAHDPARAEENAACMYVQGQLETRQRGNFFQRASELLPSFEVAQFDLATEAELLWRRRPTREENVAEIVAAEYERVLELDPGNVAAWANLGYIWWLLEDPQKAREALDRGREYKEIRRETFVAELDYCLARIAAEAGDFRRAYGHYVDAVSGHVAQGVWHAPVGYTADQFVAIPEWMLDRFTAYRRNVRREMRKTRRDASADDGTPRRVRRAVYGFVLNDYGEACLNYWLRSGDARYFKIARHAFEAALEGPSSPARESNGGLGKTRPQTRNPVVAFNLNRLRRWEIDWIDTSQRDLRRPEQPEIAMADAKRLLEFNPGDTHIDRALTFEPNWTDGLLEKAWSDMVLARKSRAVARSLSSFAQQQRKEAQLKLEEGGRYEPTSSLAEQQAPHQQEFKQKLTGSSTTQSAGQTPAEQRRQESTSLLARANELDDQAETLHGRAAAFDEQARSAPEKLLPHEWLRRNGSFDWSAPARRHLAHRWERELDVPHVWAIFALCRAELNRLEGLQGRRGRREISKTQQRVWRMLELLRDRFWPDAPDLLTTCGEFPGRKPEEIGECLLRIRHLVVRWCERDPSYWAFQNLMADDLKLDVSRIEPSLVRAEDTLLTELEKSLGGTRARRPWSTPLLSSTEVRGMLAALQENRAASEDVRGQIDHALANLRENADLRPVLRSIFDFLSAMRAQGGVRPTVYQGIAEALDRRDATAAAEDFARSLVRIAKLLDDLRRNSGDPRSLFERVAKVLREHGDTYEAGIADAVSESVALLQAMRGDRGVPLSLYALIGDALHERGHIQGALDAYALGDEARRQADSGDAGAAVSDGSKRELDARADGARILRGIGRVHWEQGRYDEAIKQFEAIRRPVETLGDSWRSDLVTELLAGASAVGGDPARGYRLLKNWLGRELTRAHARALKLGDDDSASAAEDAASAVIHVTRERYVDLIRRRGGGPIEDAERPIGNAILEAEWRLFVSEERKPLPVVDQIYTKLPVLRDETAKEAGLVLPPVLIRASLDLSPETYRVHVDGVPVAQHTFTAEELSSHPDNAPAGESELSKKDAWRAREMLEHLRAAVLRRPEGLPLSRWAVELYERSKGVRLVPEARHRLLAVLRALVSEGVPITDLRAVVDEFVAAEHRAETRDVVESVRFALRSAIPGTDGSRRLFALPPDLERTVSGLLRFSRGHCFLAAPFPEILKLSEELANVLDDVDDDAALVVLTPDLRPFVRRLVARRRPDLPVLAYSELPEGSMSRIQPLQALLSTS
jgi:tetratricopeptide (TPR) repeat protein